MKIYEDSKYGKPKIPQFMGKIIIKIFHTNEEYIKATIEGEDIEEHLKQLTPYNRMLDNGELWYKNDNGDYIVDFTNNIFQYMRIIKYGENSLFFGAKKLKLGEYPKILQFADCSINFQIEMIREEEIKISNYELKYTEYGKKILQFIDKMELQNIMEENMKWFKGK